MDKTLENPDNLANTKTIFLINRETGEFTVLNRNFILDFFTNTVFLIESSFPKMVCFGYHDNGLWHFKGMGASGTNADPFAAAIETLLKAFGDSFE